MIKHHTLMLMQGIDHRKWSGMSSFIEFIALHEKASDLLSHHNSCSQPCLLLPYMHITVYHFWSLNLCLHFPLSIYPLSEILLLFLTIQILPVSQGPVKVLSPWRSLPTPIILTKIIQHLRALVLRFPTVSFFSVSSKFS